jgi:glycosyltransferase involved in cell wall biosynthesis
MTGSGLVSIVVPVYNLAPYVAQCLTSIAGQTYGDWEALVVVDPSSDGTEDVLRGLDLDERFQIILNPFKEGVSHARNQGLELAKGKYVTFLDGDDFWDKDFLTEAISTLQSRGGDFFFSAYVLEGETIHHRSIYKPGKLMEGDILMAYLQGKVKVANCGAILIRKEILDREGLKFVEDCSHSEDAEFRLKLFSGGKARGSDRALFHLVTREGSLSRSFYIKEFSDMVEAYGRALAFIETRREDHRKVRDQIERWNLPMGAVEYLYKAGMTRDGWRALRHLKKNGLSRYLLQLRPGKLNDLPFFYFLLLAGLFPMLRKAVVQFGLD